MSGIEGFAAVSLAGNILQFVTTAKSLLSTTRELLDSGVKDAHRELESIAKDWRSRVEPLIAPAERSGSSLEVLAFQCKETADSLLAILEKLRSDEDCNKWKSFLQALRSQWHEHEIEDLRKRLTTIGQAVCARLADDQQLQIQAQVNILLEENQRMRGSRSEELEELKSLVEDLQVNIQQKYTHEEELTNQIDRIAADGKLYSAELLLLQCLHFPCIEDRYSSVSRAHLETLSWVFDSTDYPENGDNPATIVQWLSSDDDLYWISGRPGSGKSTLMKFLFTHNETMEHLALWAKEDEVFIAEYFFWIAGKNELQKSLEGLIRSLIYQLLRQHPHSIGKVFPSIHDIFVHTIPTSYSPKNNAVSSGIPKDTAGWMNALQNTCDALARCKKRMCFFIDGLDEYSGNCNQLINLIQALKGLENVKVCVASRRWNEFERAFGKNHANRLFMENFNHQDITAYVENEFEKDGDYQELQDVETRGRALVDEIVVAANGVFLWVVVVVRSLLEGLREGDGIDRLVNRLRDLPTDLSDLYARILFKDVEQTHRERAARMFLVTLEAKENLPLMAYWFLDEPEVISERQPLAIAKASYRHKMVKKKLIANGKGLLEPRYHVATIPRHQLPSTILFDYKVDLLHRSVREYLGSSTTDLHAWLPSDFDVNKAICNILFSQIKTSPHEQEYRFHIKSLYDVFEHHARNVADDTTLQEVSAELESIVHEYGVRIPSRSEKTEVRNLANSTPLNAQTSSQTSNSAVNSVEVIESKPALPRKQPSTARRLFRKITGTEDRAIVISNDS